jgi:hypothetical protein
MGSIHSWGMWVGLLDFLIASSRDLVLQTVVHEMKKRCSGKSVNQLWSWVIF